MSSQMLLKVTVCYLLTTVLVPAPCQSASKIDYYDLYDYLFVDDNFYNKEVRPSEGSNSTLDIFMVFNLLSINDVDEKQQTLITSARLQMYWEDYYLSWVESDYGGIQSILVPQKQVFLPDVVVANSVSAQTQLGYDQLRVRVYSDGTVEWQPTLILSTSCDIDITFFPFDTQVCKMVFETAVATKEEIYIAINSADPIGMKEFSENGLWEILETSAENTENNGTKSVIAFDIKIRRRRTYYVMNIILPVFFLSLTSSLVFALPGDEGEKMGTGITVLLSYTVYLSILGDLVPNTSLQVSILGLYLIILLAFSTISLIVCVFILRLHARDDTEPVGPKVTKVMRHVIKLFFWRKKTGSADQNSVTPLPVVSDDVTLKDKSRLNVPNGKSRRASSAEPLEPEKEPLTWKEVANNLDMFCFILFTFLTILTTVVCLLAVGVGGAINQPSI